jgi:GntR family transcriptional regulator/MocR family aminotransferase
MDQRLSPLWSSLALDRALAASLQDQIVAFFRDGVLSGRLKPGLRVPSSRALAAEHGIARITAVEAYERLVAEGYLVARRGAGLFVADSVPEDHLRAPPRATTVRQRQRRGAHRQVASAPLPTIPSRPREVLPLAVGIPALDHFPWAEWARLSARLHRERPREALSYGDPRGAPALRQAIAAYLGVARGIACDAEQILVVSGSQQGIDLAARALADAGDAVWFEEPGYPIGRAAFAAAGLTPVPVPVDEEGLDCAAGRRLAPRARLAFVTPSHQYPLGMTMSLRRRRALLDWAEDADAWILEDDYDGEFRYVGRPLAPLYNLDRGARVLYLGTFSKVLAPGLRLGYLVVPTDLVARFTAVKAAADRQAPGLVQPILARFIAEGRFGAHLRRMRMLYAARRRALVEALRREGEGRLDVLPASEAGLHIVATLRGAASDTAASARALEQRVFAAPLSTFYAGRRRRRGFVLGFASAPETALAAAVRRLAGVISA